MRVGAGWLIPILGSEQLFCVRVFIVSQGRLMGDVTEVFKMMRAFDQANGEKLFPLASN